GMTTGGKAVVIFTGDNQACQHGINACKSAVNDKYLISESFISSPSKKMIDSVF
ncbi:MAG: BMC domain-containing protein, partial [Halanaerobium sp. MSAO_Bac5]